MIAQKHMPKIAVLLMAAAVCLCLAGMVFAGEITEAFGSSGIGMEYASRLFDTEEILRINLVMDEEEWEDMLANATAETYYACDVEINGEMFYHVGIRPKGNTSLTSIAGDPDTDRYSLKLEFDQYESGQTCYGLDKLILNNHYADATSMKEALVYDMYQYLGADASLYNYAEISVNGEYWGLYLALEAVEDSFLLRNYGTENGALYKPDSMNMGDKGDQDFHDMQPPEQQQEQEQGQPRDRERKEEFKPGGQEDSADGRGLAETIPDAENASFPGNGGPGGFSMGGNGANLNYTDESLDSYSTIWDGKVTDTSEADHKRVAEALKNISEGTDLENYMDVDNLLKYMAVHVFSVNEDSLSGMMAHNYYLYESDGRLNILPWDYNLAFGGMGGMGGMRERDGGKNGSDSGNGNDSATRMVNDAIDHAFSGTEFFDTLMENEEYHTRYYGYLKQLAEEYIDGGRFETFYQRTRSQIDSLVEQDPTAFYTYEEYEEALDIFYEVVRLRGQSISGQIEGTIPSTEEEQRDSDALIDASHLDLSVMGSMSMGERMRDWNVEESGDKKEETAGDPEGGPAERELTDREERQVEVMARPIDGDGFTWEPEASPGGGEMPGGGQQPEQAGMMPNEMPSDMPGDIPDDMAGVMPNMNFDRRDTSRMVTDNLVLYSMCTGILVAALVSAKRYRRRKH